MSNFRLKELKSLFFLLFFFYVFIFQEVAGHAVLQEG